jgi:hypothetical protein
MDLVSALYVYCLIVGVIGFPVALLAYIADKLEERYERNRRYL